jgi:hypothetical protein
MGTDERTRPGRDAHRRIAERHGATNARVFGPVACGCAFQPHAA